jgi:hypothetical protein
MSEETNRPDEDPTQGDEGPGGVPTEADDETPGADPTQAG